MMYGHTNIKFTYAVDQMDHYSETNFYQKCGTHPQLHHHLQCTTKGKKKPSFEEINLFGPFQGTVANCIRQSWIISRQNQFTRYFCAEFPIRNITNSNRFSFYTTNWGQMSLAVWLHCACDRLEPIQCFGWLSDSVYVLWVSCDRHSWMSKQDA